MINIVIPMAGAGSRFSRAGFKEPKPLIPVNGVPMIRLVIVNLTPRHKHRFIFLCQSAHVSEFGLKERFGDWAPGSIVVPINGLTEGAACTVLLARSFISGTDPLVIANSDQYIEGDFNDFLNNMGGLDGIIMTMLAGDPKWSFVSLNQEGLVTRVAEKQVISNEATVGIYGFSRGIDFVNAADAMMRAGERVNGEFYVAPTYNAMIRDGKRIGTFSVGRVGSGMHGLGTPEDLELFLRSSVGRAVGRNKC